MNEFKFNCPKCGQHILANAAWIGRRLNCPSCDTPITVSAPTKPPKKKASAAGAPAGAKAKLPGAALQAKPSVKPEKTIPAPANATQKKEPVTGTPTVAKATPPTETLRVEPPVKTDKAGDAPAKVPTPTAPAPVAPADKRPKPSVATLRVDAPVKADETGTPPAKAVKTNDSVTGAPAVEKAKPATPTVRVEPLVTADKTETAPIPTSQPTPQAAEAGKPEATPPQPESDATPDATKPPEQPRVAVLTPAVKLEMVRAVRRRIAEESAWLPGKVEGTIAYAAKMSEGKPVLLDTTNSEATRFSLMGAFLLEMHVRQVITVATGRKKFLDEEIPEAVREVLLEQMDDEEREHGEDSLAGKDLLSISHAQCLAALDVLEERYSQRMDQLRIEKARKRLGTERLPDLVKKLEKKARILPEDVATALYHELMDVRRRLERLESRLSQNK